MPNPTVIDLKKATVYFADGNTTPTRLEIKMDDGNITYSEKVNREYRLNRGLLDTVRDGDEEPLEVTLQGRFNSITSDSGEDITITEFLRREGAGSALVSAAADTCAPFAIDIIVEVEQECGTLLDEVITFSEFRYEEIGGDFQAGQLSITGKCNSTRPTAIRTALA